MNCKYCQNDKCIMEGIPNEVLGKCPDAKATNADRIRAMTDEEMAAILLDLFADFYAVEWHLANILDWLKEDAT